MKRRTNGRYVTFAVITAGAVLWCSLRAVPIEAVYPIERARRVFLNRVWPRVAGCFRGSEACAENVRLRSMVDSLTVLRGDVDRLEAENARLRKVLDYAAGESGRWLPAEVLSVDGGAAGARRTIRVGRGSSSGVVVGAAVVAAEGLVGRVLSVTPHTADVALLTDPLIRVACQIEGASDQKGILSGGAADSLVLRHLRDAMSLQPHARVVTSGQGGVFPKGVAVGVFLHVLKADDGGLEAVVEPAVDFSALEDVFIRRES